jgi:hypothetical protein
MIDIEDLKKYLLTPKDISQDTNEQKATTLVLHFIGYVARPIGIDHELYKKCIQAFNEHRGKVEWEIEAVLKVLDQDTQLKKETL